MTERGPHHCVYFNIEKVAGKFSDLSKPTRFIELRVQ